MPPNTVYVGRPTMFGNPFRVSGCTQEERVCILEMYRRIFEGDDRKKWREEIQCALKGKDLACWCRLSDPCHADVLLEIANQ